MSARSSWALILALVSAGGPACDPGAPLVSPPAQASAPISATVPAARASAPPPAEAPAAPASAGPGLVVDATGSEPRFPLASRPARDAAQRVRLTVATEAAAGPEGGRTAFTGVPGIELDVDLQAAGRAGWVDLRLAGARATDARLGGGAAAPAPGADLVALVNGALQPLTGLVASAPRASAPDEASGPPRPWRFVAPAGAPAEVAELLANLHDALDPLTLALPAEPLGAGAAFTETLPLGGGDAGGAPGGTLVRTAKVVRIDAEGATLAVSLRLRGVAGNRRGSPAGALEGEGEGTLEVAAGRPFPVRGALTLETRRTAFLPADTGRAGREAPAWRLTTRTALTLEPR